MKKADLLRLACDSTDDASFISEPLLAAKHFKPEADRAMAFHVPAVDDDPELKLKLLPIDFPYWQVRLAQQVGDRVSDIVIPRRKFFVWGDIRLLLAVMLDG